jgi:septal ring factor EnvC (AmiA/AmiB activator)
MGSRQTDPAIGRWLGRSAAALLIVFAWSSGVAQTPSPSVAGKRQQLHDAEAATAVQLAAHDRAMAQWQAAQAEAARLADQRTALAAQLRGAEVQTDAALRQLDALEYRRETARQKLEADEAALRPVLALIERLARYPAETLLTVPASAESAVRGLLVLQGLTQQLEQQAESLHRQQAEVDGLTAQVNAQARELAAAQAAQAAQAALLDRQIAASTHTAQVAQDAGRQASRRAAAAAAQADTLRGAIAELEAQPRRPALPQAATPPPEPRAQLTAPMAGSVIRAFGDPTDAGPAAGLSYAGPPNARVVSPCRGKVVFAAPFRSFGLLLIVDCGGGYHVVLAGLDRLDSQVGQPVQAGEPVGVMAAWDPHVAGQRPSLYVELRHDGVPVNPAPWLPTGSGLHAGRAS